MAWVTWRQHRSALTGVAVLLAALTLCLWIVGLQVHHAYTAALACHPASSYACSGLVSRFNDMDDFLANGGMLQAVPALIGAFAGAPVLARELESGTFRFAWTQGFGRRRWTLAKLLSLAVLVSAAAGAFSLLLDWYYQPYFAASNQNLSLSGAPSLAPTLFDLRGITFAAWTLTAFAIGVLAGILIRRVVPAIAATLAVYAGIAFATALYLRPDYLAPLVTSAQNVPSSASVIGQWGTRNGHFAFAGQPPLSLLDQYCSAPAHATHVSKTAIITQCLSRHGYRWWTSYQPASRFWTFQWVESGWLLVFSALLILATIWLVRRRTA
jgi:ABC-2 family transporter protein